MKINCCILYMTRRQDSIILNINFNTLIKGEKKSTEDIFIFIHNLVHTICGKHLNRNVHRRSQKPSSSF